MNNANLELGGLNNDDEAIDFNQLAFQECELAKYVEEMHKENV